MKGIGRKVWVIAEGYIPGTSTGPAPAMTSHEAMCFLNAGEEDAHLRVAIFLEDRDPVGPYIFTVSARRTRHVRFNNLKDPAEIPRDTACSSLIESDAPVVVQQPDSIHALPRTRSSALSPIRSIDLLTINSPVSYVRHS